MRPCFPGDAAAQSEQQPSHCAFETTILPPPATDLVLVAAAVGDVAFTHKLAVPPRMPRLALCVTGTLQVSPYDVRQPLTAKGKLADERQFLKLLARGGVHTTIFTVLDTKTYQPKPKRLSAKWRAAATSVSELRGCGSGAVDEQVNTTYGAAAMSKWQAWPQSWSEVTKLLNAAWADVAEVAVLEDYTEPGYCCVQNCSCGQSYSRWWEQVAKHDRCYDHVERHERAVAPRASHTHTVPAH